MDLKTFSFTVPVSLRVLENASHPDPPEGGRGGREGKRKDEEEGVEEVGVRTTYVNIPPKKEEWKKVSSF